MPDQTSKVAGFPGFYLESGGGDGGPAICGMELKRGAGKLFVTDLAMRASCVPGDGWGFGDIDDGTRDFRI